MGIPKFFRWLVRRYPCILANIDTEDDVPPIDNLYLDLNGVIHNATHSNDPKKLERISKAKDFEIIWAEVVQYIDDIIHLVKPREMCMFAVDGVAPRAKMNQQRSRRFRTAQERHELKKLAEEAIIEQDTSLQVSDMFDVNGISPGTDFMTELNRKLDYFIQHKINTDPVYGKIQIILSGSDVPGEGEHKIMEYIRWYKNDSSYRPNTRHCIYGQDADLIMLSLLSHEPNFTIIREEVKYKREQAEGIVRNEFIITNNFQLLYLPLLRQYLDMEFKHVLDDVELEYNLERIIDDIIFFCFFVGNDFLPSLSVLDIAEASVDTLFDIYKDSLPKIGNYITENGLIYWDRAEVLIQGLAKHELTVLHSRMVKIMNFERRAENQEAQFFKGKDRVHYYKIREKQMELLNYKKKNFIQKLKDEGVDKQYKKNVLEQREQRKLKKMQLDVGEERKTKGNSKKMRFGVLVDEDDDSDEQDLDWMEEDYTHEKGEEANDDIDPDTLNRVASEHEESKTTGTPSEPQAAEKVRETVPKASPSEAPTQDYEEEKIETSKGIEEGEGESTDIYDPTDKLSDLNVHDINDEDVSEIDLDELMELEVTVGQELSKEMIMRLKIAEESRKKNQDFVKNLCERYKEKPEAAKAYYYREKVNFNVDTEHG